MHFVEQTSMCQLRTSRIVSIQFSPNENDTVIKTLKLSPVTPANFIRSRFTISNILSSYFWHPEYGLVQPTGE